MSNPGDQDIGWGKVLRLTLKFACGALALFYGWICWQGVSVKWWGLWLIAVLSFTGGAIQIIGAAFEAIKLVLRLRRWKNIKTLVQNPALTGWRRIVILRIVSPRIEGLANELALWMVEPVEGTSVTRLCKAETCRY